MDNLPSAATSNPAPEAHGSSAKPLRRRLMVAAAVLSVLFTLYAGSYFGLLWAMGKGYPVYRLIRLDAVYGPLQQYCRSDLPGSTAAAATGNWLLFGGSKSWEECHRAVVDLKSGRTQSD